MKQDGDVLTVRPVGQLGGSTAATFGAELRLAISVDASTVVLDLRDVRIVDSIGVQAVVRIANHSLGAPAGFRMRRPPPSVREALEGAGLTHLLPSVD